MVTPEEIKKKAERRFVDFLRAKAGGRADFFPLEVRCDKKADFPDFKSFGEAVSRLQFGSKERKGYGYVLHTERRKTRCFGEQDLPVRVTIDTEEDFLKLAGKEQEAERFMQVMERTSATFPELAECLLANVAEVLGNYDDWDGILKVCAFFRMNPVPGKFVRELGIGVHTKFIEQHTKILRPLLNVVVGDKVNAEGKTFYARFNLKEGDPQISFRVLDRELCDRCFSGFTYNTVFLCEFSRLSAPVKRVLIVENKLNLLKTIELLPSAKNTLAVWGSGYKAVQFKEIGWFNDVELLYWGDIDAQGYEILYQVRRCFPHVKSVLMDREALEAHPAKVKGTESRLKKAIGLSGEENEIYTFVKAENVRFEQEYLPEQFVREYLSRIM